MNCYTIFKRTGTHADTLAAIGAADVLKQLEPRIVEWEDRFEIQLRRRLLATDQMEMRVKRVNHSYRCFPGLRGIALLASTAGLCAAQGITEITLPGTHVFPESITSTADGTLIIGSLGHGDILRVAPKKTAADSGSSLAPAASMACAAFLQMRRANNCGSAPTILKTRASRPRL